MDGQQRHGELIINGAADATNFNYTPAAPYTFNRIRSGRWCGRRPSAYFAGAVDEVRVSTAVRLGRLDRDGVQQPVGAEQLLLAFRRGLRLERHRLDRHRQLVGAGHLGRNQVPTQCNPVNIVNTTTVTLDTIAMASTTTINGTLKFARSGDNEFTMVGGSMSVNAGGTLDMGTQASPIPQGTTAYLVLSSGTHAGNTG